MMVSRMCGYISRLSVLSKLSGVDVGCCSAVGEMYVQVATFCEKWDIQEPHAGDVAGGSGVFEVEDRLDDPNMVMSELGG